MNFQNNHGDSFRIFKWGILNIHEVTSWEYLKADVMGILEYSWSDVMGILNIQKKSCIF